MKALTQNYSTIKLLIRKEKQENRKWIDGFNQKRRINGFRRNGDGT